MLRNLLDWGFKLGGLFLIIDSPCFIVDTIVIDLKLYYGTKRYYYSYFICSLRGIEKNV
jgi:hypothetical protein